MVHHGAGESPRPQRQAKPQQQLIALVNRLAAEEFWQNVIRPTSAQQRPVRVYRRLARDVAATVAAAHDQHPLAAQDLRRVVAGRVTRLARKLARKLAPPQVPLVPVGNHYAAIEALFTAAQPNEPARMIPLLRWRRG